MRSSSRPPDRHRLTWRASSPDRGSPGPLDGLPRPLTDRALGTAGPGRWVRRLLIVGIAGTIGAGALAVGPSLVAEPIAPVGVVQGAVGTAAASPDVEPAPTGAAGPAAPIVRAPREARDGSDIRVASVGPALPSMLGGYRWPLPKGRLTLPFGPSPWGSRIVDGERFHDGIDLATFCGDRVVAAHAGTVLAAGRHYDQHMGWIGDLGPYTRRLDKKRLWSTLPIVVIVDDGNGYRSIYAHFGKVVVKKGATVRAGQLLGYEGATGRASGCHLHYGLFSPLETRRFEIEKSVVKRMKVPRYQTARVDPMLVLPDRPKPSKKAAPSPSAATEATD